MSIAKITPEEFDAFNKRLTNHDWGYDQSDDHRAWRRGHDAAAQLHFDAKKHTTLNEMLLAWRDYCFGAIGIKQNEILRAARIQGLREQLMAQHQPQLETIGAK